MHIIESFAHGKIADNSYSEDRLIISKSSAGIIDGSRGPGYMECDVIQYALDKAVNLLKTLPIDTTPHATVSALTNMLHQTKHEMGVSEDRYSGGFGFIVYIPRRRQIWRVGDCAFRYAGKTHLNEIELEFIAARQRTVMIEAMMLRGKSIDDILKSDEYASVFTPFFAPLLDFANNDDHELGFGVINGIAVPEKFIQIFDIPNNAKSLVMTSDGYPQVCDTLEESEKALSAILKRDPLCISENMTSKGMLPGQVSFDDRSYLKLEI